MTPFAQRTRRTIAAAVACGVAATLMLYAIPWLFGSPVSLVGVTWRGVDATARVDLERQFRLSEATPLGGARWQYVPLEPTAPVLRAIVRDPHVAATDGIDRRALRMSPRGPKTARRGGLFHVPALASRGAKLVAYLLFVGAALLLFAASAAAAGVDLGGVSDLIARIRTRPRAALSAACTAAVRFLGRGVPIASAESAAAFRVVFGTLALWFALAHPAREVDMRPEALIEASGLQYVVASWLSAHPDAVGLIDRLLQVCGCFFIVGLVSRLASAAFAAVFLLWACAFTLQISHHTVSALALTLLCMVAAPAGDAWSIDAWRRRRMGRRASPPWGKGYGFTSWVPGFVFGVVFLAAAWSKVGDGPQWVLNGTVQYHFLSDLDDALVDWGPALTRYQPVAIAMSAVGVAVELALIVASFTRSAGVRLLLGVSAAILLTGFALFQGVIWPAWWILLISFLPWERIGRRGAQSEAPGSELPMVQRGVILAVLALQVLASMRSLEVRPLLSAYDMYSTTYSTPDEYEASSNLVYRVVVGNRPTVDMPKCNLDDAAVRRIVAAESAANQLAREWASLGASCQATMDAVASFTLEGDRRVYDFEARRFVWKRAVDTVGPFRGVGASGLVP